MFRFTLLNQSFDFGDPPKVPWRGEFHEGNNPLRRMNLAYFGWAVPMLESGDKRGIGTVLRLLRSLETQNGFT